MMFYVEPGIRAPTKDMKIVNEGYLANSEPDLRFPSLTRVAEVEVVTLNLIRAAHVQRVGS